MTMEKQAKVYLAVDLGATSGRVIAGVWSADKRELKLETVNRFSSPITRVDGRLHWDILGIYSSIKRGLKLAASTYGNRIESVGVDSWAVDYALIDANGAMLGNPFHYRDSRTEGMMDAVFNKVPEETIYRETGIQFLFINTIYQLYSEIVGNVGALQAARRILFIPDLISFWLSGSLHQERTVASTSQLLNPMTGKWSETLLERLDLLPGLFKEVVEPGTIVGSLKPEVQKETRLSDISVIAVAGHDTASAFVALPGNRKEFAVMSSGTWSLMGLELPEPQLGTNALNDGFSNEIGYGNTVRFLKNICGMWLIEECRRHWTEAGRNYDYEAIVDLANGVPSMVSMIDPDAPDFAAPEHMPDAISAFCQRTGQKVPADDASLVRCVFDSLAMKYRYVFRKLEAYSDQSLEGLYVLGGGARNHLLNQMTADALGVPVVAGPSEATAVGNIAVQMISKGEIDSLESARDLVEESFLSKVFEPCDTGPYTDNEVRFSKLLDC